MLSFKKDFPKRWHRYIGNIIVISEVHQLDVWTIEACDLFQFLKLLQFFPILFISKKKL
jgi:hypothetical protein